MKLKKHISKLLFCSMLFNSVPFYSNAASNSNLSRYETLEGEFIDLGDTDSKDISEIEIFGNTVQDPNNLEDIQSVGELYIDEQGREQYKIEIKSYGKNMWNRHYPSRGKLDESTGEYVVNNGFRVTDFIYVKENTYYSYTGGLRSGPCFYDKNKQFLGYKSGNPGQFETPSGTHFIRFASYNVPEYTNYGLMEGIYNSAVPLEYVEDKVVILLPCQLYKVGDIADKLYWDSQKERYIIEKNIDRILLDINNLDNGDNFSNYYSIYIDRSKMVGIKNGLLTSFSFITNMESYHYPTMKAENIGVCWGSNAFIVSVNKNKAVDSGEAVIYLNNYKPYIYYPLQTSKIIETNITKKIKLTTYPEKTYISTSTENGVKPTLKIKVDRIEQVSEESVDNAVSSPTSSNIALARMFVNMLPESSYKDQLQAKLNEIFSEDMVLEKQSATANLDVYIQSENILMMSLDTNTVTFEDYSGVEELELQDAINISINSSLPYQLNAYIVGGITNKDKDKNLDLDVLNIKDGGQVDYKKFDSINSKLVLLDNVEKGNNNSHNIDLKLNGDKAHDADVYKATIKFEAEQK